MKHAHTHSLIFILTPSHPYILTFTSPLKITLMLMLTLIHIHSLTNSSTHTHSPTRPLTLTPPLVLSHSPTRPLTLSFIHSIALEDQKAHLHTLKVTTLCKPSRGFLQEEEKRGMCNPIVGGPRALYFSL